MYYLINSVTTPNNLSTEASCLGEHGVAVSAEKRSSFPGAPIPRRALQVPTEIQFFSRARLRYAPRDKMPQLIRYQISYQIPFKNL